MKIVKPNKRRKPLEKKIEFFSGLTKHNIAADIILKHAMGELDGVVIAGYDKRGEYYFASSYADGGDCLWLIEKLKKQLLGYGG